MKTLIDRRKLGVTLVSLVLGVCFVGDTAAGNRRGSNAKARGQMAVVEAVDLAARTITLQGTVYIVPANASLTDSDDNRIRLNQIRAVGSLPSAHLVEYWPRGNGRGSSPEIRRLTIKPMMRP